MKTDNSLQTDNLLTPLTPSTQVSNTIWTTNNNVASLNYPSLFNARSPPQCNHLGVGSSVGWRTNHAYHHPMGMAWWSFWDIRTWRTLVLVHGVLCGGGTSWSSTGPQQADPRKGIYSSRISPSCILHVGQYAKKAISFLMMIPTTFVLHVTAWQLCSQRLPFLGLTTYGQVIINYAQTKFQSC